MKKLYLALLLSLLFNTVFWGQYIELPTAYIRNELYGNNTLPEKVIGSPYFTSAFSESQVSFNDDTYKINLRYNRYLDEFEILVNDDSIAFLVKKPGLKVTYQNENYEVFSHNDKRNTTLSYFKILNNGKNRLLVKEGVNLKDAVPAANSYATDKPARFEEYKNYYLLLENQNPLEIRLKKKDILNILKNSDIENYIEKNRIKLQTEADVIKLLNYLN